MTAAKKSKPKSQAMRYAQIENISIAGSPPERMGPLGLHHYAEAYLQSARALPIPDVRFEPVRPYLICHAVELGLKAFLSLKGMKMMDLAGGPYGHKLDVILDKAEREGLAELVSLTDTQRSEIRQATDYYNGKVFEYPTIGETLTAYRKMPSLDPLFEAATILVDALRQPCLEA